MEQSSGPARDLWTALGWEPSPEQLLDLIRLQELLRQWNRQLNLTRLVEGEDYWINQVFDSLWPLQRELQSPDQPRSGIDVGTGGGFPGLAMAIALPGFQKSMTGIKEEGGKAGGRRQHGTRQMERGEEEAKKAPRHPHRIETSSA